MKFKIYLTMAVCALILLTQFVEAQTQRKDGSALTVDVPVEATLQTQKTKLSVKGNLSLSLEVLPEQLKKNIVDVKAFNLAFFGVEQVALSGKETSMKLGVLGMSIPASAQNVQMRYDTKTQTLTGEIPVQVHFPQIDEIFPPEMIKGSRGEDDFAVSRTQSGKVQIQIKLAEGLDRFTAQAESSKKITKATAETKMQIEVQPLEDNRFTIAAYRLDITAVRAPIDIGILTLYEAAKSLCIQPVRIRSSAADATPTGAGLAFGMPGANTQWRKADVVFQVRSWMTVTNSALKIATEGTEETNIRNSTNVDDCIEVFFVQNFDPVDLHGGGATWSSGTANAKIISSDGNAVGGIDFTHLGHELGHVLNMGHPGNPGGLFNASTNTLMCPSGWRRDNPARNSVDIRNNVSNPLLRVSLKPISAGPNCTASGDCGACP